MKTAKRFNGNWFVAALVLAVLIAETIAWLLSRHAGFRISPIIAGVLGVGAVNAFVAWYYEGTDIG